MTTSRVLQIKLEALCRVEGVLVTFISTAWGEICHSCTQIVIIYTFKYKFGITDKGNLSLQVQNTRGIGNLLFEVLLQFLTTVLRKREEPFEVYLRNIRMIKLGGLWTCNNQQRQGRPISITEVAKEPFSRFQLKGKRPSNAICFP